MEHSANSYAAKRKTTTHNTMKWMAVFLVTFLSLPILASCGTRQCETTGCSNDVASIKSVYCEWHECTVKDCYGESFYCPIHEFDVENCYGLDHGYCPDHALAIVESRSNSSSSSTYSSNSDSDNSYSNNSSSSYGTKPTDNSIKDTQYDSSNGQTYIWYNDGSIGVTDGWGNVVREMPDGSRWSSTDEGKTWSKYR